MWLLFAKLFIIFLKDLLTERVQKVNFFLWLCVLELQGVLLEVVADLDIIFAIKGGILDYG